MKLWMLSRLDGYGYDEYDSKIVRAPTEDEAREIANESTGFEGSIWTDKSLVECSQLKASGEAGEIRGSFNAG